MDRHVRACIISRHRISSGIHAWRKLIRQLIEMKSLFGPFADYLYNPIRVCYDTMFHVVATNWQSWLLLSFFWPYIIFCRVYEKPLGRCILLAVLRCTCLKSKILEFEKN